MNSSFPRDDFSINSTVVASQLLPQRFSAQSPEQPGAASAVLQPDRA